MKRRTTAAVIGGVAGSALVVGLRLAVPASADQLAAPAGADPLATPTVSPSVSPSAPCCPAPSASPSGSRSPSVPVTRSPSATRSPSVPATRSPSVTGSPSGSPSGSATAPGCVTVSGDGVTVARPGVGVVTVTIAVCGRTIEYATNTHTQSNWNANRDALKALDILAVKYYATDISKIHYSGATLTSNAYRTSLRSAITKAGI